MKTVIEGNYGAKIAADTWAGRYLSCRYCKSLNMIESRQDVRIRPSGERFVTCPECQSSIRCGSWPFMKGAIRAWFYGVNE